MLIPNLQEEVLPALIDHATQRTLPLIQSFQHLVHSNIRRIRQVRPGEGEEPSYMNMLLTGLLVLGAAYYVYGFFKDFACIIFAIFVLNAVISPP